MSKTKRSNPPKLHPRQAQQPATVGYVTPPQRVQTALVHRTIGEDIAFDQCVHAMQLLPNQAVLLLVTDESEEAGVAQSHTFLLGEEVTGITVKHVMVDEKTDAEPILGET